MPHDHRFCAFLPIAIDPSLMVDAPIDRNGVTFGEVFMGEFSIVAPQFDGVPRCGALASVIWIWASMGCDAQCAKCVAFFGVI